MACDAGAIWEAGQFRHQDHRFEWTRPQFQTWANDVASRFGYAVTYQPVAVHKNAFFVEKDSEGRHGLVVSAEKTKSNPTAHDTDIVPVWTVLPLHAS